MIKIYSRYCRIFDSDDNLDMFYRLLTKSILDTSRKNKMADKQFLSECAKLCIQIRHSYENRCPNIMH